MNGYIKTYKSVINGKHTDMAKKGTFQANNPGKPKGAINKKTRAWNLLGDFFTEAGAERAKEIIIQADDKEFMMYYEKLLEYFKPKLNRTDLTTGDKPFDSLPVNITIKRDS